jgi:hypothetical protein
VKRLLLLAALLLAVGCGGGEEPESAPTILPPAPETTTSLPEPTTEETTTKETATEAEPPAPQSPPGVPDYVAGYRSWTKLNEAPIPPRDNDPHNGTKDVYVSREQRGNGRYPPGTIVVKDAVRPGTDFIGLIAVMRKVPGADPAHRNWVFVEYTRDARNERFQEIASGAVCWSCHLGALENDYVFTE